MLMAMTTPLAHAANAYSEHPNLTSYGTIQKDVYKDRSVFAYVDDDGLTSTLPFERQNNNITITYGNIVWANPYHNKTINKATQITATALDKTTETYDLLSNNDLEYMYLNMVNSSVVTTSTWYVDRMHMEVSGEPAVDEDDYLVTSLKVDSTGANLAIKQAVTGYIFKDLGAVHRSIRVFARVGGTYDITVSSNNVSIVIPVVDNTHELIQLKISDILTEAGVSWEPVKLIGVTQEVAMNTHSTTLDVSSAVAGYWYAQKVLSTPLKIDDGNTDKLLVNGTSGQFPYEMDEIIEFEGLAITKIKDVSINYEYEDPEATGVYSDGTQGFNYEWTVNLPKTTETTADTLTYSNTNATLKCWFDGSYATSYSVRGEDKLELIENKDVITTTGLDTVDRSWSQGPVTNLTPGTDYIIKLRFGNLPESITTALTTDGSTARSVRNVKDWGGIIWDALVGLGSAAANLIGFGAVFWSKLKKKSRISTFKMVDLALLLAPSPMGLMGMSMPVMRSKNKKDEIEVWGEGESIGEGTWVFSMLAFIASLFLNMYPVAWLPSYSTTLLSVAGWGLILLDRVR